MATTKNAETKTPTRPPATAPIALNDSSLPLPALVEIEGSVVAVTLVTVALEGPVLVIVEGEVEAVLDGLVMVVCGGIVTPPTVKTNRYINLNCEGVYVEITAEIG
jgi:hypothetical protein